jgi:hypothetical protein
MKQKEKYAKWELLAKMAELDEYKKNIQYQNDPESRKNKMKARLLGKLLKKEIDSKYKTLKWSHSQASQHSSDQ